MAVREGYVAVPGIDAGVESEIHFRGDDDAAIRLRPTTDAIVPSCEM